MKTKLHILAILLIVALLTLTLFGCGKPSPWEHATCTESTAFGSGEHTLTVTVTAEDKSVVLTVYTDADNVKDALLEHDLIDGEQQAIGYLMSTVIGMRADYELDGAYWAFCQNGEFMMTGIDSTPIEGDAAYEFVYTKA